MSKARKFLYYFLGLSIGGGIANGIIESPISIVFGNIIGIAATYIFLEEK